MGRRRTAAERNQDRKLGFVPLWPIVGIVAVIAVMLFLSSR
jgi:type VI protein secretion system component VasF